jgi:membrane protein implicated in regulation of membrane protease activity
VVLGVGELLTLTFVLAMFAGGAAVAAAVAAIGADGAVQGVAFGVVSLAGLLVVLPIARRHSSGPSLRTGTAALVGRRGRTLTAVSSRNGGRVLLAGEEWSATPYDDSLVIPADTDVDVLAIDGAKAVVHPLALPLGGGTEPS